MTHDGRCTVFSAGLHPLGDHFSTPFSPEIPKIAKKWSYRGNPPNKQRVLFIRAPIFWRAVYSWRAVYLGSNSCTVYYVGTNGVLFIWWGGSRHTLYLTQINIIRDFLGCGTWFTADGWPT